MKKVTIYTRIDGRFEIRYFYGYKKNGEANYNSVYGRTEDDVLEAYQNRINYLIKKRDLLIYDRDYIGYYINSWMNSSGISNKLSTNSNYEYVLFKRIIPKFAGIKKCNLSIDVINDFTFELKKEGLMDKTIRDYLIIFQQILRYGGIDIKIPVPRIRNNEIQVFTLKEQRKLERELFKEFNTINFGIYFALYTGVRIGELCALQWKRIDVLNQRVFIKYTLIRVRNKDEEDERKTKVIMDNPKSYSSIRYVPIPNFLVPKLKELEQEATPDTFLISGTERYIETRTYYNKYRKLLIKLGLPNYDFHATRHTFATRSIARGTDPKTLSKILGHSNVKITLERYVHPDFKDQLDAVNKLKPLSGIKKSRN